MSNICRSKSIVLRCTAWTLDGLKEALEKSIQGELSIAKLEQNQATLNTEVSNISGSVDTIKELSEETQKNLPTSIHDTIKGSSELQELIRGEAGHTPNIRWAGTSLLIDDLQAVNLKGEPGVNPKPSEVAELIAGSKQYKDLITQGLATENKVREIARSLDKEIKVGGRNLIHNSNKSLSNSEYFVGRYDISDPSLMVAGEDYTIQIWGDIEGGDFSETIWVYNSGGNTEVANIQNFENGVWQMTFKWRDDSDKRNGWLSLYRRANHPNFKNSYNTTITRIKLERGTIATDWTPAPEDIDSALSTKADTATTTAITHELGEWKQAVGTLSTRVGKQEQITKEQKEALATKADTATTTAIAKELGEYEEELVTLSTRVEGQGQQVREQGNQIGEQRKALTKYATELGNSQTIIQKLEKLTSQLKEGKLDSDSLPLKLKWLLDALNNGETTLEGGLMLTKIIGLSNHEGKITAYLSGYNEGGGKVLRAGIVTEYGVVSTPSVKEWLQSKGCDTSTLPDLDKGYTTMAKFKEWAKAYPKIGMFFLFYSTSKESERDIIFPFDWSNNSSTIRYNDTIKIKGYRPTDQEQVAIHHDGRGHFGDIYLNRDIIDFKRSETDKPYLSVGEADAEFIDDFLKNVRTDTTPINEGSIKLNNSNREYTRTLTAPENGTSLNITIEKLKSEAYKVFGGAESWLILSLDGQALGAWQGETESKFVKNPLNDEISLQTDYTPKEASNLSYSLYLNKGSHTLKLAIVGNNKGEAEVEGLKASLYYDSGQTQTYIRGSGLRFFGSADRFVDIDYRKEVWMDMGLPSGDIWLNDNPYTMRVKGGVKVDKLVADEVETTGAVLCGGRVRGDGYFDSSFGKYKNMRGGSYSRAEYDKTNNIFKVYHSIGHQNYTPIVTSAAGAWGDVPQVVGVWSYSFDIKFINSNNQASYGWPFTFVCYKGD